ncbi:hypothetical protein [Dyadobacter sp. NIV53]|uniref:hypothetical protein n=1 Tax=Dyadobacter sp. NIV53 TaxID=2861765 RepID=UPI001C88861F|nr:hypothetical protein [Dyadobacter sp. NIV53]
MILKITNKEGFSYELPVSCLKYSRITKTWVVYSKAVNKRKSMAISNAVAESLLKEKVTTRHDRGDYVLFQVNASDMFIDPTKGNVIFDPKKHL